jgi:hypothetical protein
MSLTKTDFGKMLMAKLKETCDIITLSRWAYQIYLDNSRNLEPDLKDVLLDLGRMENAPEFEYTITELDDLASTLVSDKRC